MKAFLDQINLDEAIQQVRSVGQILDTEECTKNFDLYLKRFREKIGELEDSNEPEGDEAVCKIGLYNALLGAAEYLLSHAKNREEAAEHINFGLGVAAQKVFLKQKPSHMIENLTIKLTE